MFNDILLVTAVFLIRIAFPIAATFVIGSMLNRALHPKALDAQR